MSEDEKRGVKELGVEGSGRDESVRRIRSRRGANIVEGAAASGSVVCLLHCLALPAMALAGPLAIGIALDDDAFHLVLFALVVPFALVAFALGHRHHRDGRPAVLGLIGLTGLAAAVLPVTPHAWETAITAVASLVLVASHLWNWRLRGM